MKKRTFLFVAQLVLFSLLAVGCSQTASGPSTDDDIWSLAQEIEYRDGNWKFEDWNFSLNGRQDYFELANYTDPEEGKFLFDSSSNRFVSVNTWESIIPQYGNFLFGPVEKSQEFMISLDKPDDQNYLLGLTNRYQRYDEDTEYLDYVYRVVRVIEPIEDGNRLYFPLGSVLFDYLEEGSSVYKMVQLYHEDGSLYTGPLKNIVVAGADAKGYPLEFNVNLVVAGKYNGTSDGLSAEKLADKILERLNRAMNPGGITVRKINVLYAKDHPAVGDEFPESEKIVITRASGGMHGSLDSLAHYSGHEGEINIVLGYYIVDEIGGSETVGGFSPLMGHIYNGEEDDQMYYSDDCVFIVTHGLKGEYHFSSDMIASTALHELGHFFGMNHTTDASGFDDYDDTPECTNYARDYRVCPDRHYVMFPTGVSDWEYSTFTPQQMDVVRYYLALNPHK